MVDGQGSGGDADVEASASLADGRTGGHGAAVSSSEALTGKKPGSWSGTEKGKWPLRQAGAGLSQVGWSHWDGPQPAWEHHSWPSATATRGFPGRTDPCDFGARLLCAKAGV